MIRKLTTTLVALGLGLGPAISDEKRELGAHQHGHGTFNIAVEGNRVSMELEVPGMDIVGFEQAAKTDAQKSKVEAATTKLKDPLALFKLPTAAGCKLASAEVKVEAENDQHQEKTEKGNDHNHDDKAKGGEEHEGHTEFHAAYALDCEAPAELTAIDFAYFKAFEGAEELDVNVVTPKSQNKFEVTRAKPSLDLGGMM